MRRSTRRRRQLAPPPPTRRSRTTAPSRTGRTPSSPSSTPRRATTSSRCAASTRRRRVRASPTPRAQRRHEHRHYGTAISCPPRRQARQVAANATWLRGPASVKVGGEYNHVSSPTRPSGSTSSASSLISATATILDLLSPGRRCRTASIDRNAPTAPARQPAAELGTDEVAVSPRTPGACAELHRELRPPLGRRSQPRPASDNASLVNRIKGFQFPIGRSTDPRPSRSGCPVEPLGRLLVGSLERRRPPCAGFGGLYYARSPGDPPGRAHQRLPHPRATSRPCSRSATPGVNNTIYQQFKLIGIDLNRPLDQLPT